MKDLTVNMENRPGTLADLGEALGRAGVNLEGLCGFPYKGEAIIHILVEDADKAQRALEKANFEVRAIRDVLVIDVHPIVGKPGTGGKMARKIADVGVNIDLIYQQ